MKQAQVEVRRWMEETGKIKVLCTTAFVGSLARSVGGDQVDVLDLINRQNDPHSYQLVKGDDEKFRCADIVFSSGLGLEQTASLVRYLTLYKACAIGDYISRSTRRALSIGPTPDPHIWMDISLWARGVRIIARRLSELKPELSEYFHDRASVTMRNLMEVHKGIREKIQTIPQNKRYLVTTHDAFHYFCRAYLASAKEIQDGTWKERCIAPEGFAPESQISTQDLSEVVSYILQHHVKEVCSEAGINQDSIQKVIDVCKENGSLVRISKDFLYSDTMGPMMTYEEMMEHDAKVIYESLMKADD